MVKRKVEELDAVNVKTEVQGEPGVNKKAKPGPSAGQAKKPKKDGQGDSKKAEGKKKRTHLGKFTVRESTAAVIPNVRADPNLSTPTIQMSIAEEDMILIEGIESGKTGMQLVALLPHRHHNSVRQRVAIHFERLRSMAGQ
ncbi:unnamed protein product [Sympodiomycopsis kandeliae]